MVTLKKLGLRVQLGHWDGQSCALPVRAHGDDFVVVDQTGVHEIGLDFCGCETAQHHVIQLLRKRWFPSTSKAPRTAATFRVLEFFQLLTFESKASVFEFYNTLTRWTDNTGIGEVPVTQFDFLY